MQNFRVNMCKIDIINLTICRNNFKSNFTSIKIKSCLSNFHFHLKFIPKSFSFFMYQTCYKTLLCNEYPQK